MDTDVNPQPDFKPSKQTAFHVVGVGASAGGLEALEEFFQALSSKTGMAFVVVQHLSPDFKSQMQQLLGRCTQMTIHLVKDGMQVEPDSIYLPPPRMEVSISKGRLHLKEMHNQHGISQIIDNFLHSLAADFKELAIGIILSGSGSDGSTGIQKIHNSGGLVIAQDPESAKFNSMPTRAVETGAVHLTLPPASIADAITRFVREPVPPEKYAETQFAEVTLTGMSSILSLLQKDHGVDFTNYKSATVGRRIKRRMDMLHLETLEEYIAKINEDSDELHQLYKDLLIGVTHFFRDPLAFNKLAQEVIPKIFSKGEEGATIRMWVAACATGEEAYSIAMLFDEERRRLNSSIEIKIFATDVHQQSLQTAAKGIFPKVAIHELSEDRRSRYFRKEQSNYRVTKELRDMIVFAPHNIITDAPFTQMDLVTCRNMLIYLLPAAQKRALSMFHFALKLEAFLFLGPSESLIDFKDEFIDIDKKWKIYFKRRDVRLPLGSEIPLGKSMISHSMKQPLKSRSASHDRRLLGVYDRLLNLRMPPSILTDDEGHILHIFAGAERYIQPHSGRQSTLLLDSVEPQLAKAISFALQHARQKQESVQFDGVELSKETGAQRLNLIVTPVNDESNVPDNFLIEFNVEQESESVRRPEVSSIGSGDLLNLAENRVASLTTELKYSEENLQATLEEMETSNEELQASNEELMAANEELQSTNEELHSVNEELYTVNAEHQRKVTELALANDDMDNLLATTRVGVIFLDNELNIRRFTPEIAKVMHLVPQDVGRSIRGFANNLNHPDLYDDLELVLQTEQEIERTTESRNGNPYLLRILPYQSGQSSTGVVLTLVDIKSLVKAEEDLKRFQFMAESAVDAVTLLKRTGGFNYANPAMSDMLGYESNELEELSICDIVDDLDMATYQKKFDAVISGELNILVTNWIRKDRSTFPVEVSVSAVEIRGENYICARALDITERLAAELELHVQHQAIESTLNGVIITDPTRKGNPITYANPGFLTLSGYNKSEILGANCRFLQGVDTDREKVRLLRENIARGEASRVIIKNYRKDGSSFWNDLQITPIHNDQGKLVNFVGVQNDVTEQMLAQQALEKANAASREANLAKNAFLANMSHELRTPMTAVLGFADILKSSVHKDEDVERIDTIIRNGKYLLALLNDILDLSKIEAGKIQFDNQPVDIRDVLIEVQALMNVRAAEADIPLHFNWNSKVPAEMSIDVIRMRQILVNLISNALKFTHEGNVNVSIEVIGDQLRIAVEDTGIGIGRDKLPFLFQPFSRVSENHSRTYDGTGLGLSISQRLAEAMGCEITVMSELGEGSCFTLCLPVSIDQLDDLVSPYVPRESESKLKVKHDQLPSINGKILLADDRRDIWRIGKHILEKCGANVSIAQNGKEAVDLVRESVESNEAFDIILMDMQMPIMSGQEAIKEIRQHGIDIPIVALTADAMEGSREDFLDMGCNDYCPKPIDAYHLTNLIANLLQHQ